MSKNPSFNYPVILDLSGKPCLVVGGGAVAQRKVKKLIKAGAQVSVVAPLVTGFIEELQKDGKITLFQREFEPGDLDGQTLVFGALDNPEARRNLAVEARKRGIPANLADDPQNCDFIIPSSFSRGDLLVTVSTNGKSPAMSRKLRQVLEQKVGPSFSMQVKAMSKVRERVMQDLPDHEGVRREVLVGIVNSDLLDVFRSGDEGSFWERVDQMIIHAVEKTKTNE